MDTIANIFGAIVLALVLLLGAHVADYISDHYESFPYERKAP